MSDVESAEEISEAEIGKRILDQFFELWFTPECNRRRERGEIADDFVLHAAQALQDDNGQTNIRLNTEVKGHFRIRVDRPVEKGEAVELRDWEGVEDFELDASELDYGHATIIRIKDRWFVAFNFLRGRALAARLIDLSEEYWTAARYSVQNELQGPAIDNCFSAAELVAKAHLILHMSPAAKSRTHGPIHSAINNWANLGNISQDFVQLFNWLGRQRQNARYSPSSQLETLTASSLEIIHREIAWVRGYWRQAEAHLNTDAMK